MSSLAVVTGHDLVSTGALALIAESRGAPLPSRVRRSMEALFGHSFDSVRVHVGSPAAAVLGARAFTHGEDIHFAPGEYAPESPPGRWLLGHELAHVVQQRHGRVSISSGDELVVFDEALEHEADAMAALAVLGVRGPSNRASAMHARTSRAVIQCKILDKDKKEFASTEAVFKHIEQTYPKLARLLKDEPTSKRIDDLVKSDDTVPLAELLQSIVAESSKVNGRIATLQRRFRGKRAIKGAIAIDQLKDAKFGKLRRKELEAIIGDIYLASLFGFRTARDQSQSSLKSLVLGHTDSTAYMRDGAGLKKLADLYKKHNIDPSKHKLVNSEFIQQKLRVLLKNEDYSRKISFQTLAPCIVVMTAEPENLEGTADIWRSDLGAHCSAYQIEKALRGKEKAGEGDYENGKFLAGLLASAAFADLAETGISATAKHLILGLDGVRKLTQTKFDKSTAVHAALQSIDRIVRALGSASADSLTTARLYELLNDELFVVLGAVEPYNASSFEQAIKDIYTSRIPSYELPIKAVCLESSGMGALSTALAAALVDYEDGKISNLHTGSDYFEMTELLGLCQKAKAEHRATEVEKANIIYATLNPSTPARDPVDIVKAIIDGVNGRIDEKITPVTLVIDMTIEIDGGTNSQLDRIFGGLAKHIKNNDLNVILAKSYQKYSALGSGKMSAGLVVVVNAGSKRFEKSSKFVCNAMTTHNFMQLTENQLMTFYLTVAAPDEIALIRRAAVNAAALHDGVWKPKEPTSDQYGSYTRGLPFFLLAATRCLEALHTNLLWPFGIEYRNSFGYVVTSYLPIGHGFRISVGQETLPELVEKLYAVGYITNEVHEAATHEIYKVLTSLLQAIPKGPYGGNKFASLLHLAASLDTEDHGMRDQLAKGLKLLMNDHEAFGELSAMMRDHIVLHWLRHIDHEEIGGLNDQTMATLRKYAVHVQPARLATSFITHPPEKTFEKLSVPMQRALTELSLGTLDADTLVFVCSRLAKEGAVAKLRRVGELLDERMVVYVVTEESLQSREVKTCAKELGIGEQLPGLRDRVCSTRSEFVGELRTLIENSKLSEKQQKALDELVKRARLPRETCFHITLGDIREVVPKQEKALSHLVRKRFASVKALADEIGKSLGEHSSPYAQRLLAGQAKHRASRVLRNRGLSDIAGEMHLDAVERIRELQGRLMKLIELTRPKSPLEQLFSGKNSDNDAQREKADIVKLIEALMIRANNTGFCVQKLSEN